MLSWLHDFLIRYPELALFLVISAGYVIGNLRIGTFGLGPVTGSLFAGIFLGQFVEVPTSSMTKSFLFLLFLFGIGYSVGPQFMQALKRDGAKPIMLAFVCCFTGLAASIVISKILGLNPGLAAGLMSGALTESPAMGTATEAINALPLPETERARLVAHVAVADAVCYVFGAAGVILFCTVIAPALLKIDLKAEALKLERELGIVREKPGVMSGRRRFELRAYRMPPASPLIGLSVAQAEARIPDFRIFIHRIRRDQSLLDAAPDTILAKGDVITLSGPRQAVIELIDPHAEEVEDIELLDVPVALVDVIVSNPDVAGKPLLGLAKESWARGVYLRSVSRGGQDIPLAPGIAGERGDIIRIVGPEDAVTAAAARIGTAISAKPATDFIVLGLAIFLGGLVGVLIAVPIGGIRLSLGSSLGALFAGLIVGHMRTRFPLFGRIPDEAIALMTALGLAAFVGMTGLHAGPIFLSAVRETGLGLLFGGAIVTLLPMFVGLAFGHYVLRMNPIILLGALAGAQTVTAAMAAVQDRSGSSLPVLGYTPAYPIGHILLTLWGSIMVIVMAG
jgi:putative transport protein